MFLHILFSVLIVLGVGALVQRWVNNQPNSLSQITNREFLWTSALITVLIVPLTTWASWKISQNNQLDYVEHHNGWEVQAVHTRITCHRDGRCVMTYDCDPYIVMVTYTYSCGKNRTCTGVRPETRYHSCPYAKEEWQHSVKTTLGEFDISGRRLPPDYASNPWRYGHVASRWTADRYGVGHPQRWVDAKTRIAKDSAGPVTSLHHYENYVLASQITVLKTAVKTDIASYQKDSLLPMIQRPVIHEYGMDKVYPVKVALPPNFREMTHRLSATLGFHLKGDLRIVVVGTGITNLDEYTNTLKAFWQSRAMQESNHALPKNALVIVLKTDGKTILESRSFTGMPTGNEFLLDALNTKLAGLPYETEALVGHAKYRSAKNVPLDKMGKIGEITMTGNFAYKREHMDYYSYLRGDVHPSTAAKVWAFILSLVLGSLAWCIPVAVHCPTETRTRYWR